MSTSTSTETNGIYCVKCRAKQQVSEVKTEKVDFTRKKTGKPGERWCMTGKCPKCGINMKKFIKKPEEAAAAVEESKQ